MFTWLILISRNPESGTKQSDIGANLRQEENVMESVGSPLERMENKAQNSISKWERNNEAEVVITKVTVDEKLKKI